MAKKLVVGNWKLNPQTLAEALTLAKTTEKLAVKSKKVSLVVCPPYPFISALQKITKASALGSQNFSCEEKGSHTGEVALSMLTSCGVTYSLIGHSERRLRGETDEQINTKVLRALGNGVRPIICIGEKERNANGTHLTTIEGQLKTALHTVGEKDFAKVIIAYEPVWAIGAASAMEPTDIHEMVMYIKKFLSTLYGKVAWETLVLYGGSVGKENAESIFKIGNVDGLLIGRQSLSVESLAEIVSFAEKIK
jgi:triosephosphate isomerase